jgi:hypothetical protein
MKKVVECLDFSEFKKILCLELVNASQLANDFVKNSNVEKDSNGANAYYERPFQGRTTFANELYNEMRNKYKEKRPNDCL